MKWTIALFLFASAPMLFGQTRVNPIDDGTIFSDEAVDRTDYIVVGESEEGAMDFAGFNASNDVVDLTVNPYGEPMWEPTVDVYGILDSGATISGSDYSRGMLVGILTNLSSLGYGQDASLNVTNFVDEATGSNFEFILVDASTTETSVDVLSSTNYNYGHSSGLVITAVPEPSTCAMIGLGFIALLISQRRIGAGVK